MSSPDPDCNCDARDYFARHMRVLERCASAWPVPEIQSQIDSLRLTFSADVNRPFELKESFYVDPVPTTAFDTSQYSVHANEAPSTTTASIPDQVHYGMHSPTNAEVSRAQQSYPYDYVQQTLPGGEDLYVPFVDKRAWDPIRIMRWANDPNI